MFCFVLSIHLNVFSNQVYTSVSLYPPNLIYLLGLDRQMYKFVRSSVQSLGLDVYPFQMTIF